MTVMRTRQAVIQALSDELESDPTVFLMGEDIGSGGPFKAWPFLEQGLELQLWACAQ